MKRGLEEAKDWYEMAGKTVGREQAEVRGCQCQPRVDYKYVDQEGENWEVGLKVAGNLEDLDLGLSARK